MKALLFLLIFPAAVFSQTIGIEKQITLSDKTIGKFITVGQIVYEPPIWKIELKLYKDKSAYQSGAERMPFRYEVQFSDSGFVFTNENLYDKILIDSLFINAKRITL